VSGAPNFAPDTHPRGERNIQLGSPVDWFFEVGVVKFTALSCILAMAVRARRKIHLLIEALIRIGVARKIPGVMKASEHMQAAPYVQKVEEI